MGEGALNTGLLYTLGVGNIRTYIAIMAVQLSLFLLTMDNPMRGIWIALILAFIVSIVGILVVQYYNGETATVDGTTRYIRNIDDKIRLSRRVLAITYGISFALLLILYFASPLVASYFMFTDQ